MRYFTSGYVAEDQYFGEIISKYKNELEDYANTTHAFNYLDIIRDWMPFVPLLPQDPDLLNKFISMNIFAICKFISEGEQRIGWVKRCILC